ncbi:2-oxoacid ferredoxin oxidoreductase [Candidatus Micrarchaeota archaeon]|nr:2-oxoacid ferredoxin oxidoreductase [Candidatus Micrarchaeota archaeon]
MSTIQDYTTMEKPQWCPGCGNFGLHMAVKSALSELNIPREKAVICTGIGCSGKSNHYVNCYGYEGLHGRSVPVASGVKLSNKSLTVIAEGGDGDGYGIGSAHFLHSFRRNIDMTYIVHDNAIYGLTTGQASPMTQKGMKTKSTPHGNLEIPFHPLAVAIAGGCTFVSRVFTGDLMHMKEVLKQAISHKGFALVDVLQPCVTFNKLNTFAWWQQRVYKLDSSYNPQNKTAALEKAFEESATDYAKIPIGIFYKEERPTYEEEAPQLKEKPLVEHEIAKENIQKAVEDFL